MMTTRAVSMASQLVRRSAVVSKKGTNVTAMLGLSAVSSTAMTLCEGSDENVMDKLTNMVAKDKEGNFDFNGTLDKIASEVGAQATSVIETGVPTQISYGFMSGFCAGYALKKVGRAAAVVIGVGFMGLQSLSYAGYIQVDHATLKKDVENFMDLNKDGVVDQEDGKEAMNKLLEIFEYNLPSGSGFGVGFLGGLRSG